MRCWMKLLQTRKKRKCVFVILIAFSLCSESIVSVKTNKNICVYTKRKNPQTKKNISTNGNFVVNLHTQTHTVTGKRESG